MADVSAFRYNKTVNLAPIASGAIDVQKLLRRPMMTLLEVKNLKKTYATRFGNVKVHALTNVNFTAEKGEYIAFFFFFFTSDASCVILLI